jgi:hypothetical protein
MKHSKVAAFDLLALLFIIFLARALITDIVVKRTQSIESLGVYAVVMRWPNHSPDDYDLYVRAPSGEITYFAHTVSTGVHLEWDDLGSKASLVSTNGERIVITSNRPGEYIVNVHAYAKISQGPVRVTVSLYRLAGDDRLIGSRVVTISRSGEEQTAFRFANGKITGDLPFQMVKLVP